MSVDTLQLQAVPGFTGEEHSGEERHCLGLAGLAGLAGLLTSLVSLRSQRWGRRAGM